MKMFLVSILSMSMFVGCESTAPNQEDSTKAAMIQAEEIENFACINEQAGTAIAVSEATSTIVGEWQLKAMLTMIQKKEIPNYSLKINSDLSVTVFKGGKKIHEDKLTISKETGENYSTLKVESSRENFSADDFNFLYGNLRICEKELLIDNGMMFDAPAYYFRKK